MSEILSFNNANIEIKGIGLEKENAIVHYISTPDIDRVRDIINPVGGDFSEFEKTRTVFFNHNYFMPVAKNMWLKANEEGIKAKTVFSKTPFAQELYLMHKEGILNSWSIGFDVIRNKSGLAEDNSVLFDEENKTRIFNKWKLLEYSSAPLPANPNAIDHAKSICKSYEMKKEITKIEAEIEVKSRMEKFDELIEGINSLKAKNNELENFIRSEIEKHNNQINDISSKISVENAEIADKEQAESLVKNALIGAISEVTGRKIRL